ncbi:MAG: hypothetical protein KGY80_12425 [Candidatus Thorarchaeota archaeon]|nr:hypothetical protein [Candidatus Thorarchaeota archaeon]
MFILGTTYIALVLGLLVWLIGKYSEKQHFGLNSENEKKTKSELERKDGPSKDVWLLTTINCDFGTVPQTAGPARTLKVGSPRTDSIKTIQQSKQQVSVE